MGTRGIIGVLIDGRPKVSYNHFDSYPTGLGVDLLAEIYDVDFGRLRELARDLVVVDEDTIPTPEQIASLEKYHDGSVSTGKKQEWYSLLHDLQGRLLETLRAGIMVDAGGFPTNSLFCEWGYVLNFDDGTFDVYRGFQKERPTAGLWAGLPTDEDLAEDIAWLRKQGNDAYANIKQKELEAGDSYKAINLIKSYPLNALPKPEVFVEECMKAAYGDDYNEEA